MTKFAAYDHSSIYAIGETRETAMTNARVDARDDTAEFKTAPISDYLAAWIDENGWDGNRNSFELDAAGYILNTTRR